VSEKLKEMWQVLEAYQPYADSAGHGKSWARMCKERTWEAAWDAYESAPEWTAAASAAFSAEIAVAATARGDIKWGQESAQRAIDALKEVEP
jgi:hypothetical protein